MSKEYIVCTCCGKSKAPENYYASHSYIHRNNNKLSVCKDCIWSYVVTDENEYDKEKMIDILQMLDKPFISALLTSSENEAKEVNKNAFKLYMKNLGLQQNRNKRWRDGDISVNANKNEVAPKEDVDTTPKEIKTSESDEKNRNDVIRMLGYDPFMFENESDKVGLYNRLVDFLDENTLEDNFKLPAVIEIVKTFNQIDKINYAISKITSDVDNFAEKVGSVNSLITAKEKMLKSVLALAKDNGISVNHNNNKSKGGNTLNGIVRKLNEIGLSSAELNLFDIETSESMKQVADLSNRSILDQLMLDENDYTDMIAQQKEMISQLDEKLIKEEEDNRLLRLEIAKLKGDLRTL
ncbi:hypothetical protein [uncultured Metabacillus sp.]|uniref:hypothetical protein n=1 Tax=uncultured Metabacillus sp. TaxID=2860135 RepID=UPI00261FF5BD|nr:hypothetical protein [uncultured Metabacillus sp.]